MTGAPQAVRRLLLVTAAVVLLGHGGVELAPRLLAGGATVVATSGGTPTAGRAASSRPAAESQPVERGATLRTSPGSALMPSGSTDPAAGPGSGPLVATALPAARVDPPPTPQVAGSATGRVNERGPPGAAGT